MIFLKHRFLLVTGFILFTLISPASSMPSLQNKIDVSQHDTNIQAPMMILQVMLETYALDHHGQYPASLKELYELAQKDGYNFDEIVVRKPDGQVSTEKVLEDVVYMDTQTVTHQENLLQKKLITGNLKYLLYQEGYTIKSHYQDEDSLQMPPRGAVVYAPLYPDLPHQKITGYLILRLNKNKQYYTKKGKLFYLSNLHESELPATISLNTERNKEQLFYNVAEVNDCMN